MNKANRILLINIIAFFYTQRPQRFSQTCLPVGRGHRGNYNVLSGQKRLIPKQCPLCYPLSTQCLKI
jgi:hypothetical protein